MGNAKTMNWTAENDAKLLLTILAVENVRPNAEKIAAAFGNGVGAGAIASRLHRLRQKAKSAGLDAGGPSSKSSNKDGSGSATAKKGKSNIQKPGEYKGDEIGDNETMNVNDTIAQQLNLSGTSNSNNGIKPSTPKGDKIIAGRVEKIRKSPRATHKNYKALEDPFTAMEAVDDNGEDIFPAEHSESEGSYPTDQEFEGKAEEVFVKVEDDFEDAV